MTAGDLHIHTSASDGLVAPEEAARQAHGAGLGFFSVTDHNSVAGLARVGGALPADGPRFVLGVELSAQPKDADEIHLLGYGIDPACPQLLEACRAITGRKVEQIHEIGRRLHAEGVEVDLEAILLAREGAYVGRPMLADLLVRSGTVGTLRQAFQRYLGREGSAYVRMAHFSPRRCVEAIHAAGGLTVLAHPNVTTVDRWIEPLVAMGLDGVEAYRPRLSGNRQLYVEKAAEHFGVFLTGGSDWHGRPDEPPLGAFDVPAALLGPFFERLDAP